MKKTRILALTLAVLMLLALASCGGGQQTPTGTQEPSGTQEPTGTQEPALPGDTDMKLDTPAKLRMGTGGTSGTYYPYGGIISSVLMGHIEGLDITVMSTGASKANVSSVADGEIDIAMVQNDVMDYAISGTFLFDEKETGFSAMAGLYSEACQVVAKPGINSVSDLRGKSVSIGDAGSGVSFNAIQILEAYGLTVDDITVQYLNFADSADAFKDGKIDAFFCVAGAPTTAITELATMNDIVLLEIDDEHADALMAKYPFYTKLAIQGGEYKGVENTVQTVAVKATFIVADSLSEDVVYYMTKVLFEYKDEIAETHAKGVYLDAAYAVEGISIPYHPGALKYFKEIGVL